MIACYMKMTLISNFLRNCIFLQNSLVVLVLSWCFNRLCILKCVLNGWLYSFTGIVNSCISEVVNNSNVDFFIGALIQNQQGQHQLNLVSIKMFEEIFLFFSMPYWCSKDCHVLRSYRLLRKKFYKQSEKVLNWPLIFSSNSRC